MTTQNDDFTIAERDRLNALFPVNDSATQSFMWRMILDQWAENIDANDDEMTKFERDLKTAQRLHYCMANCEGRFGDFYRAMGLRDLERSMKELSRLGDPTFIEPARHWAQKQLADATGGARVKLGWRQALKHVLTMFGEKAVVKKNNNDDDDDDGAAPNRMRDVIESWLRCWPR